MRESASIREDAIVYFSITVMRLQRMRAKNAGKATYQAILSVT